MFWPEFFRTFYDKFLPNCEKEYFVFTDAPAIEYEDAPGVHRIYQEPYPWPYSTLKRFSIFLTQETVLSKMDYLFFFNANLTCTQTITEEEFLPRPARGENLLLVQQPSKTNRPSRKAGCSASGGRSARTTCPTGTACGTPCCIKP